MVELDARRAGVSPAPGYRRAVTAAAVVLSVLIAAWVLLNFSLDRGGFALSVPPKLRGGEEAVSAFARLFAALVLSLFPADGIGRRLHWVAGGLAVLGLGHLVFGYLEPALQGGGDVGLYEGLYEGMIARSVAGVFFVVGLAPREPPRLS